MRVFRRYLKLFPENAEEYIEYLQEIDKLDEAAVLLTKLVNDDFFQSNEGIILLFLIYSPSFSD